MTCILSENIGKQLEYITEIQPGSGNSVKVTVTSEPKNKEEILTSSNSEILRKAFRDICAVQIEKSYQWIGISSIIRADQPCCWVLSYEDYYTLEQYDSRNVECRAEAGFNFKTADFSLTYNGTVYDDCRMVLIINHPHTAEPNAALEIQINVFYLIPEGYDGCVLGFHNSSALTEQQIEKGMSDPAASLGLISRAEGDLYIRLK